MSTKPNKRRQRKPSLDLSRLTDEELRVHRTRIVRESNLRRQFGIGIDDFDRMVETRNNKCDICGADGRDNKKGSLHLDHCHTSGEIRGLLCPSCNMAIGLLKDDPKLLAAAIRYLKAH